MANSKLYMQMVNGKLYIDMVLPITFFGPVSWYEQIARASEPIFIEAHENFQKQTLRTRCRIATANGVQTLTVPVSGSGSIKDIKISDHNNWRHLHWQALSSAYGSSPFFEYYADDIAPFFEKKWDFLFDYNLEITHKMCELLDIHTEIRLTEEYQGCTRNQVNDCKPYYQVFKSRHGFLPDLSILDLLFNMGPESILCLINK